MALIFYRICLCFILLHVSLAFAPVSSRTSQISTSLHALFDDEDISNFDALVRFGPAPFITRVTQPDRYWDAVEKYKKEEGCSEVEAVRNMDAYFLDPTGWVVAKQRNKLKGEPLPDYMGKSGVQKRPIFSAFWTVLLLWFFLILVPGRIGEQGIRPSAFKGGFCPPSVRVIEADGKTNFRCKQNELGETVGLLGK
mmetsp:Transcript_15409/g.18270  ORF Transcript_15409/g.18270 Transcript_15409/m.18270 type:complete len:196 (+) Transcript_15409:99-686(+)